MPFFADTRFDRLPKCGILPLIILCYLYLKFWMQAGIEIAKLFLDEGETVSGNLLIIRLCLILLPRLLAEYLYSSVALSLGLALC